MQLWREHIWRTSWELSRTNDLVRLCIAKLMATRRLLVTFIFFLDCFCQLGWLGALILDSNRSLGKPIITTKIHYCSLQPPYEVSCRRHRKLGAFQQLCFLEGADDSPLSFRCPLLVNHQRAQTIIQKAMGAEVRLISKNFL
jgi:hypothetical protein